MPRTMTDRAPRLAERLPTIRQFVVWCLLAAVSVYGASAVVTDMLGRQHVHRSVDVSSSAMQGWVDFRRAGHGVFTSAFQRHSHDTAARHHHDAADETVLASDGEPSTAAADDGANGSGGSVLLNLALAGTLRFAPRGALTFAWHRAADVPVDSRAGGRLERPPRFA
jgi:hypothetical protein